MINKSSDMIGLFELDTAGNIRYLRTASSSIAVNETSDSVGRNFFDEIAPLKNIEDLRRRFRYFVQNSEEAQKFNFICEFDDNTAEVKVLLTQIYQNERELNSHDKLIIMDIREV